MSVSDNEDHILSPGTKGLMGKIFKACSSDPRGSVHRAWGISLLFVVFYFVLAVIESKLASRSSLAYCNLLGVTFRTLEIIACLSLSFMLMILLLLLFFSDKSSIKWRFHCIGNCFHLDRVCPLDAGDLGDVCLETLPHILFHWVLIGGPGRLGQSKSHYVCSLFTV